jgi:hypothetical protein
VPSVGLSFGGVFDRPGFLGSLPWGLERASCVKDYGWGLGLGRGRQKEVPRGRLEIYLRLCAAGRESWFPMAGPLKND